MTVQGMTLYFCAGVKLFYNWNNLSSATIREHMRTKITAASLLLLFLLFHTCLAAAEQKLLEAITFDAPSATEERVAFKLNTVIIPHTFAIKGENPRVVFDFKDTRPARVLKNTINTNGKLIKRIRMGLHTEPVRKTRVVFDLTTDKAVDFKSDFNKADNTLIISVFHTDSKAASAEPVKETGPSPESSKPAKEIAAVKEEPEAPTVELEQKAAQPLVTVAPPAAEKPLATPPEKSVESAEQSAEKAEELVQPRPEPVEEIKPAAPAAAVTEKTEKEVETTAPPVTEAVPKTDKTPTVQPLATAAVTAEQAGTGETAVEKTGESPEEQIIEPETPAEPARTAEPGTASKLSTLNTITFDGTSNRGEMVLFNLDGFRPPTVFGVEKGHPKVICEFKDTRGADNLAGSINADGKYVRKIRTSRDTTANKVRVIIDLAPGNSYDLQQVFFKEDNLFVLIVNTLDGKKTR